MQKRRYNNTSGQNTLKFITYTLNQIRTDLQSKNITSTEISRLETVKNALEKEREALKKQRSSEKIESHAIQAARLIEELKNPEVKKALIRSDFPIISIADITSSTYGVKKRNKKYNG